MDKHCKHCGEEADFLYGVAVDNNGTTELWCHDCMSDCTWSCSVCFDPFSYDVEHKLNSDYEYICKNCYREGTL